ncbi:MAG: phytoene/squalene synthase family protein [Alphaproteobacteria bacterium]
MTDDAPTDPFAYCADQVRAADSDRFATVAFAPSRRRPALLALYAFNLEVAKTREVVSEPMLGAMRLQWWRESLDGIYAGTPRRHQVVLALADAVRAYDLARADFDRLLDARESDMDDAPPANLATLEAYAAETAGGLQRLVLQALGARDAASQEAAREIGTAWAMVGLLRAVPFHARSRRVYLPADLLRAARLTPGAVIETGPSAALSDVVRQVGAAAAARLEAARRRRWDLPRHALPGLMLGVLASGYLKQLRRASWDPFDARVAAPLPSRGWRLLGARFAGFY